MKQRTEIHIKQIIINGRQISRVLVDEHVFEHADITSDLVAQLVLQLDGVEQTAEDVKPPYEYFVNFVEVERKRYRLVWLLEDNQLYVGVVTAYRDKRRMKNGPSK